MIVAPAVDVKGGRCVQLVGGRAEEERVSLPDPVAVARLWYKRGFHTLHVVDLDAALDLGENHALVARIATASPARCQVGGGVRDDARATDLLGAGADRVIVGTRAVEEPRWLEGLTGRYPDRIMVAADVKAGRVLRRGWTERSAIEIDEFLAELAPLPLGGVLCTDVAREGRLDGIDIDAMGAVVARSPHPVWISGGITSIADLEALEAAGAAGAVLGMALYTARLDARAVAERWGGDGRPTDAGSPR
jgi:phosphoribosylformimino-5-aminoimidazole carboxamide ribotide isomerase